MNRRCWSILSLDCLVVARLSIGIIAHLLPITSMILITLLLTMDQPEASGEVCKAGKATSSNSSLLGEHRQPRILDAL